MNATSGICVLSLLVGADRYPVRQLMLNRRQYCDRIGARCIVLDNITPENGVGIPWYKIKETIDHAKECRRVLWIDADAVFVRDAANFADVLDHHDVAMCSDENGFNTGVAAWKLPEALPLLRAMWERRRKRYIAHPAWQEQNAAIELMPQFFKTGLRIHVMPQQSWNWRGNLLSAGFVYHIAGCYCCAPAAHCSGRLRAALRTLEQQSTPNVRIQQPSGIAFGVARMGRWLRGQGRSLGRAGRGRGRGRGRERGHSLLQGAATPLGAKGTVYHDEASKTIQQAAEDPNSMFDMSTP